MAGDRRVAAFLQTVDEDLQAADLLVAAGNRLAAFHVQQAIEKLTRAVLVARGIQVGAQHDIAVLVSRLPADDPWRARIDPLDDYSVYATAFRYPTPGGRLVEPPPREEMLADIATVRALRATAGKEL